MLITGLEDDAIREIANHILDPTDFANFRASSKVIANITKFAGTIDESEYEYRYTIRGIFPLGKSTTIVEGTKWFNFRHGQCKITFPYTIDDTPMTYSIVETYHLNTLVLVVNNVGHIIYEKRKLYACVYIYNREHVFKIYRTTPGKYTTPVYEISIMAGYIQMDRIALISNASRFTAIESFNNLLGETRKSFSHYNDGCTSYIAYDGNGKKVLESTYSTKRYHTCLKYNGGMLYHSYKKNGVSEEYIRYNPKTGQIIAHKLIYKGVLVKFHGLQKLL
jgi:hypothetical protein